MSDIPGRIQIGGRLPRPLYDSIAEGGLDDPGSYTPGRWCIEQVEDRPLLVCNDNEGSYPEHLGDELKEAGVPFDWYTEGEPGEGVENTMIVFRPGIGEYEALCDFDWDPILAVRNVEGILGNADRDPAGMVEELGRLDPVRAQRLLRDHPLPPLEIVDD